MQKSKVLFLMTKISIIIAIILSTSDDITKNSGINNGGWIPFLHVTVLGLVYAIKTQLSNKFKEIQIAPRFAKHINETSQEVVGIQTRHISYSISLSRSSDEKSSLNSSLINDSMPLSSSLLTLMKTNLNSSDYNNHNGNASIISNNSFYSPQPTNRIFRREIMLQTLPANDTIQNRGGISSEKGACIA